MGGWIEALGEQAAGGAALGAVNEGMGILFQGIKNKQQLKQAGKMQDLQIQGSKQLTDYNTAKQLQMWKDTSYGAQKEQMEKAGINPALMYGMGGGGGQTNSISAGNVGGQQASVAHGMGLQGVMTKAQLDNLNANTEKTKAEAAKISGVDTTKAQTEIASLTQGIQNQKAVESLTRVQTEIAQVAASVSRQTINEQMEAWENVVKRARHEIKGLELNNQLSEAQMNDKIELLKKQVVGEILKNELTKAQTAGTYKGIQVSQATIEKMAADITNATRGLNQKDAEIAIQKMKAEYEVTHPGLWNTLGGAVERTVNWADNTFGTETWGKKQPKQ